MAKRKLRHGSLFTGAGGIDLGFDAAGMRTVWQCDTDSQCRGVLRRHWPDAKLYDDVTTLDGVELEPVDVLSFGSPCQDLSLAGKRRGMVKGARSNLFHEAVRVIAEMREATDGKYPRYAVWENVRGALVSRQGKDFRAALAALADVGALDVAWRVVNTCHYGPPQRRLRVFVVADFGGERAGEILSHPARVLWYPPTCDEKGTDLTGRTGSSVAGGQWRGTRDVTSSLLGDSGAVCVPEAQAGMLVYSKGKRPKHADDYETWKPGVVAPTLNVFDNTSDTRATAAVVEPGYRVRRLTPRECERLQGWPDDHTRYTDTGEELTDYPRNRMIGNGVSAPVAQWIGENITRAPVARTPRHCPKTPGK